MGHLFSLSRTRINHMWPCTRNENCKIQRNIWTYTMLHAIHLHKHLIQQGNSRGTAIRIIYCISFVFISRLEQEPHSNPSHTSLILNFWILFDHIIFHFFVHSLRSLVYWMDYYYFLELTYMWVLSHVYKIQNQNKQKRKQEMRRKKEKWNHLQIDLKAAKLLRTVNMCVWIVNKNKWTQFEISIDVTFIASSEWNRGRQPSTGLRQPNSIWIQFTAINIAAHTLISLHLLSVKR